MRAEFARYVAAGLVNTAVGYAVFLAVLHLAGAPPLVANVLCYVAGLTVAYVLNLRFVFAGARHSLATTARFLGGAALAWLVNAATLEVGVRALALRAEYAQLAAMAAYTLSFYAINRAWVWARH